MAKIKKTILWFGVPTEVWISEPVVMRKIIPEELHEKKCMWCHKPLNSFRTYFCCAEHSTKFKKKLSEVIEKFYFSGNFSEERDKLIREGQNYEQQ